MDSDDPIDLPMHECLKLPIIGAACHRSRKLCIDACAAYFSSFVIVTCVVALLVLLLSQ